MKRTTPKMKKTNHPMTKENRIRRVQTRAPKRKKMTKRSQMSRETARRLPKTKRRVARERARTLTRTGTRRMEKTKTTRRRKSKKPRPVQNSDKFVKKSSRILKIRCALTCQTFVAGAGSACTFRLHSGIHVIFVLTCIKLLPGQICPATCATSGPRCAKCQKNDQFWFICESHVVL